MTFKIAKWALVALTLAPAAYAFNGPHGTTINPVNEAVFEVVGRASARGEDYWCGAADYARRELGMDWKTRLYVARGRGPSETTNRRTAIQFTLAPEAAGIQPQRPSISLNSFAVGDNMTIQSAHQYCNTPPHRF